VCLVVAEHESVKEQLDEDDIAAKLENCFVTFLLLHLGQLACSPLRSRISNFSPHLLQINSNIGILAPL
jgi:hypothetical protein